MVEASPAPGFPPEPDRPVFVFGCAFRCGSTLLQRLISSSQQVFVWGENNGLVSHLYRAGRNLSAWSKFIGEQERDFQDEGFNAWVANLNPPFPEAYVAATRAFLQTYYVAETEARGFPRWGFKEVRYDAREASLLFRCFPESRLIFLLRDPRDVLASAAGTPWYEEDGGAPAISKLWTRNVTSLLALKDPRLLTLRYEALLEDPENWVGRIAEHVQVPAESLDLGILTVKTRGTDGRPRLGEAEEAVLASSALREAATAAGY